MGKLQIKRQKSKGKRQKDYSDAKPFIKIRIKCRPFDFCPLPFDFFPF
jgi:hypothetical protein